MTLPRRQFLHLAAGAVTLAVVSSMARAQAYPSRPIRLVVPFPPGGAFDAVARPLVDKIKPLLGTVVIENIGGGGSSLGAAAVARARPDGYTTGRRHTSTKRSSKQSRSTTRSKTWIRLRAWPPMSSASPYILQCRLRPSRRSSLTRKPIPANCPTGTPVPARSNI